MMRDVVEDLKEKKNQKQLKDFLPIPILRVGKTKNKDMEITPEIFDEVASTYDPEVHEAPIVKEPHENTDAGLKEKNRGREALGFVKKVGVVTKGGEKYLAVTEMKASSPEHEKELVRLLSGPMKNNSPELDLGGRLETEFYGKEHTGDWPDNTKNKYYLRRVNLYGAVPVAQFKMPQAQFSETGDKFFSVAISKSNQEDLVMRNVNLHEEIEAKSAKLPADLPPHLKFKEAVRLVLGDVRADVQSAFKRAKPSTWEDKPDGEFGNQAEFSRNFERKYQQEEAENGVAYCPKCGGTMVWMPKKKEPSAAQLAVDDREKVLMAEKGLPRHLAFKQAIQEHAKAAGRTLMQLAEEMNTETGTYRCSSCERVNV